MMTSTLPPEDDDALWDAGAVASRDTSTSCPREYDMDETRCNASPYNSLLNLTSDAESDDDEDDDDDDDDYVLQRCSTPPPIMDPPPMMVQSPPVSAKCCATVVTTPTSFRRSTGFTGWADSFFDNSTNSLRNVTENFVDSFCPTGEEAFDMSCRDRTNVAFHCSSQQQYALELDVWHVLGCSDPTAGGGSVWPTTLHLPKAATAKPQHLVQSRRDRILKIRRLRQEIQPPSPTSVICRAKSMDDSLFTARTWKKKKEDHALGGLLRTLNLDDDPLEEYIGKGLIDPILHEEEGEDGYDSDPGEFLGPPEMPQTMTAAATTLDQEQRKPSKPNLDNNSSWYSIPHYVQETLNYTWTLTWHPTPKNWADFAETMDSSSCRPLCINLWIERGSILQQGNVVVEPCWMWREVFQPDLTTQRKLNLSTRKPYRLRLLNTLRIHPVTELDRTLYPLARQSTSFLLKSCQSDESYLFEARSPGERDEIVKRWKMVVARLASLAVLEDMHTMLKEFFTPMVISNFLEPEYP